MEGRMIEISVGSTLIQKLLMKKKKSPSGNLRSDDKIPILYKKVKILKRKSICFNNLNENYNFTFKYIDI